MHITKIELEDIKSHREATFEFQRGTTAITGENGAGKTTIIEAVAWTLFDLLDYKKDDFVRRGAKKGVVRVTFESGLDEREYSVYRDTGTGYYVYDVQLKTALPTKKKKLRAFCGRISALNREPISKRFSAARSAFRKEHLRRFSSKHRPNAKRLSINS